ncbi:S8 family peptidase [Candidatus Sulfurimonas baltica]|uniref:S8 family serine peptidase n=1 Tax=Candidatus Sulfurimonas baltica TaxID=2740404 RepID=A0A7S7LVC1_9BACT|nr:S8 family serine peptidase [Candidatus Sulfurimonas baltica]QOY51970.1 S8 family serine peptidase [Candidatus Sulfurimonas baltica]
MLKKILFPIIFLFFVACSGGGSSSSSNPSSSIQTVTGVLLDSAISGVTYSCDSTIDITTIDGNFTCPLNSTVTFTIGGINLGSFIISTAQSIEQLTPAKLYGLENDNITDIRVLNFIQLVQSLDTDNNATNGIDINSITRDNLIGFSLDISDMNTAQNDLNTTLTSIGRNLIFQNEALEHYIDTLQNTLDVTLKSEPYYYQQWYLEHNSTFYTQNNINENAHINSVNLLKSYTGNGVKIAIIDDGLDTTHEDLEGSIINSYNVSTKSTNVSHTNQSDYHGTAITGIIGARVNSKGIQGIASKSKIIFLKHKEGMSDSETIELFNKAQEFGADIINCSWGTYDVSQSVKDKIVDLANTGRDGKGTIIVFASGNDDRDMGNDESSIPEVISVGSTDKDNLRAWYGNYGENLDIVAPGGYDIGITTLDSMGSNGISSIDDNYLLYNDSNSFIGTSASAPIISGVIALMLEKNPNLTRNEIENILKNSSDKIGNVSYENERNNYYGYGKVNLERIFSLMSL